VPKKIESSTQMILLSLFPHSLVLLHLLLPDAATRAASAISLPWRLDAETSSDEESAICDALRTKNETDDQGSLIAAMPSAAAAAASTAAPPKQTTPIDAAVATTLNFETIKMKCEFVEIKCMNWK